MANNSAAAAATATAPSGYRLISPYEQLPEELQRFWTSQREEVEQMADFKSHKFPHSRIKRIMKLDKDVQMVSAEALVLFAKACELLTQELTLRSWLHTQEFKRRTLKKSDCIETIKHSDVFDFLVDVVSKDEMEEKPAGFGPGRVGSSVSGVPYCYPPMGTPAPSMRQPAPPGVPIGRRAMPWLNIRPPLQPGQSAADATGGNGGEGNHGPQS